MTFHSSLWRHSKPCAVCWKPWRAPAAPAPTGTQGTSSRSAARSRARAAACQRDTASPTAATGKERKESEGENCFLNHQWYVERTLWNCPFDRMLHPCLRAKERVHITNSPTRASLESSQTQRFYVPFSCLKFACQAPWHANEFYLLPKKQSKTKNQSPDINNTSLVTIWDFQSTSQASKVIVL